MLLAQLIASAALLGGRLRVRQNALAATRVRMSCNPVHLVWFTGSHDLRVHDHGGLIKAAESSAAFVPVFVLESHHLQSAPSTLRRLHSALSSLNTELRLCFNATLLVYRGRARDILPRLAEECAATACHVVLDDIEERSRAAQRTAAAQLSLCGVTLCTWDASLRPTAPWASSAAALPSTFAQYVAATREFETQTPHAEPRSLRPLAGLVSSGLPSIDDMLAWADDVASPSMLAARTAFPTIEPFDSELAEWSSGSAARQLLADYAREGREKFANGR